MTDSAREPDSNGNERLSRGDSFAWLHALPDHALQLLTSTFWLRWGMHFATLAAVVVSATVVWGTWHIVRTPYAVECVEPGMVQMVDRVLQGKPLYVQPALDYSPFPYGPGMFHAAAALVRAGADPLMALRWLNVAGMLLACLATYLLARAWKASLPVALIAAMWPLLSNEITGYFLGVAHSDGPYLAFLLLGFVALFRSETWRGAVLAGVFFGLAIPFKQSALMYGAFLGAAWLTVNWRQALIFGAATLTCAAPSLLPSILHNDVWAQFWLFKFASDFPFHPAGIALLGRGLLGREAIAVGLTVVGIVLVRQNGEADRARRMLAIAIAAWVPSQLLIMGVAYANSYFPATAVAGAGLAMGLTEIGNIAPSATPRMRLLRGVLPLLALFQVLALIHDTNKLAGKPEQLAAWQTYVTWLQAAPGEVIVTDDRWTPRLTQHPLTASDTVVGALGVAPHKGLPEAVRLTEAILAKIKVDRPIAVVTYSWASNMDADSDYVYIGPLNTATQWGPSIGSTGYVWQVFLRKDHALGVSARTQSVMTRLQKGETIGWPTSALQR